MTQTSRERRQFLTEHRHPAFSDKSCGECCLAAFSLVHADGCREGISADYTWLNHKAEQVPASRKDDGRSGKTPCGISPLVELPREMKIPAESLWIAVFAAKIRGEDFGHGHGKGADSGHLGRGFRRCHSRRHDCEGEHSRVCWRQGAVSNLPHLHRPLRQAFAFGVFFSRRIESPQCTEPQERDSGRRL